MTTKAKEGKPLAAVLGAAVPTHIRTQAFQAVCFFDELQKRQVVLLYSLGEDGIIREFDGKENWRAYPIKWK